MSVNVHDILGTLQAIAAAWVEIGGDTAIPACALWALLGTGPEPNAWMVTVDEECVVRVDYLAAQGELVRSGTSVGPVRDVAVPPETVAEMAELAVHGGPYPDEMQVVFLWFRT